MKKTYITNLIFVFLITSHVMHASLSAEDARKIGNLIWSNEADQRVDLLVFWSPYAPFPEIGIGHYIWYPQGQTGPYTEQFPSLCAYIEERGVQPPDWVQDALIAGGAPWQSRDEFLADKTRVGELRQFLASTVELQTEFMIKRLENEWPYIVDAAPEEKKEQVQIQFNLMRCTLLGTYALVDYLNFKGSGLNPHEERKGERWGLLQVLMDMPDDLTEENVTKSFAICAARRLILLMSNSGPEYKSVKFLAGWIKRVSTYARPTIFDSVESHRDYLWRSIAELYVGLKSVGQRFFDHISLR